MVVCRNGLFVIFTVLYLFCQTHLSIGLPTNISSNKEVNHSNKGVGKSKLGHSELSKRVPKKCEAGVVYNITYIKDLHDKQDELECIFHAGLSPSKVPEGTVYGELLDAAGYRFLNRLGPYVWKGKFIEKIDCNGTEIHRGHNIFFKQPIITFTCRISRISDDLTLHKLEKQTDKIALMIDYSKNVYDICPNLDSILEENAAKNKGVIRKSSNKIFYPISQVLDILTLVGRQPDGGAILLGKTYVIDPFSSGQTAKSIAFFYLINYDQTLNSDFKPGDALPPTEEAFNYNQPGITDIINWLLPVNNLFSKPIHSTKRMMKELMPFSRDVINFMSEFFRGIRSEDTARLLNEVQYNRPLNHTKMSPEELHEIAKAAYYLSHYNSAHSHANEL